MFARLLLGIALISSQLLPSGCATAIADGPEDNRDDVVRTIPPPGEIDESTAQKLLSDCTKVRALWQSTREQILASVGSANQTVLKARLDSLEPEVLVFPRAVELALEFRQFYRDSDVQRARGNLEMARERIELIKQGADWLTLVGITDGKSQRLVVGGFRSSIDESIQPYAVVIPSGLFAGDSRPRRLDIWFHGRGERESEMHFLAKHSVDDGIYTPADSIVLHPYGRYSNAFRFAGEKDVFEALAYIQSKLPVDEQRISVRGFSMGGAACWQFATRYADRWFAANPGAGFSETVQFLDFFQGEKVLDTAPDYQQAMWNLYDNPTVAINLTNCPTIAYSGEIDRQKQAADIMEATLKELGVQLVHIIGPNTAHKIHNDSQVEIERRMSHLARKNLGEIPMRVQFATYSLHHNTMHWIELDGLEQHWAKSTVDAQIKSLAEPQIEIKLKNVSAFTLKVAPGRWPLAMDQPVSVDVNGEVIGQVQPLSDLSLDASFYCNQGQWTAGRKSGLHKRPGLQGPIDDAFNSAFVFVLPSGKSSRAAFQTWSESEAQHAMQHWRQHFRGDLVTIQDVDLDEPTIATKNLVLFGDAESNAVIARLSSKLPLDHTRAAQRSGLDLEDVGLAMVYPNPLNPQRYVVINSGFTYREYDYLNNARQTPKLPDWAVIDVRTPITPRSPGKVQAAGFFDENWQLPK